MTASTYPKIRILTLKLVTEMKNLVLVITLTI